jgi:hypothetical protein
MAPSSTRQLAVPTWSQPLSVRPSKSWVQPVPVWLLAGGAICSAAMPATRSAADVRNARFM